MTASSSNNDDFPHVQDTIGQLESLSIYAQICLFFEVSDQTLILDKVDNLRHGLKRLADDFPWLAGQVVIEGRTEINRGVARCMRTNTPIPLVVTDQSDSQTLPGMSVMKEAGFPFSMLDATVIASQTVFGEIMDGTRENEGRVLVVDATIVDGGLLLNFAGQHHYLDMNALGQVIRLFSKACRDEPFTPTEIQEGNRSRMELIPPLGHDYRPGPELDHLIARPGPPTTNPTPPSPLTWVYFEFSAAAAAQLKALASAQQIVPYITTNDALTVFVWQHIVLARTHLRRGDSGGSSDVDTQPISSTLCRCVNSRRVFDLPPSYLSHGVTCTYLTCPSTPSTPLATLAGQSRTLIDPVRLRLTTRALVTVLRYGDPRPATVGYAATYDPRTDLIVSSWTHNPAVSSDFGAPLGVPVAARRPRFDGAAAEIEGLVYLMPRGGDGAIAVAMCLRVDEVDALRRDPEFAAYARYIG